MKKRSIIALTIFGVILLALGFFATPLVRHARARAWDSWVVITAYLFGIDGISISDSALDTLEKTSMENIRLRAELTDYTRLKAQLGSPVFDSLSTIPAQVISRPIDTLTSSYVINKGIADGVLTGAPVLVNGSVLIGFTKELSKHSAVVQTLFHPSTLVTAETVPKEDGLAARGLLKSHYQTSLSLGTVPRDAPIAIGQDIVTTNKGQGMPYGMIIGKVVSLQSQENEAYQSAVIDVPYNSDAIDAVIILRIP